MITVSERDPAVVYELFDIGVLDYDEDKQLYLVQKTNRKGRVVDTKGNAIVDGGKQADGMWPV